MVFRPAPADEQAPKAKAKSDMNRASQHQHATTDKDPQHPADSYHYGATHDQRRKHQDVLCE